MGQCLSLSIEYDVNPVNAMCPVFKETKKLPNLIGRFLISRKLINGENQVFCEENTILTSERIFELKKILLRRRDSNVLKMF
jgi:hypothetical protein